MQEVGLRRRWAMISLCVGAVMGVPVFGWSDQGAGKETGKSEVQEKVKMAAEAKVTIHDAIEAATRAVSGKVIEAELEEKPRVTWEVEVVTDDGKLMEVWVDVDSGAVVAVEEEKGESEAARQPSSRPMHGMMQGGIHRGGPQGGRGSTR